MLNIISRRFQFLAISGLLVLISIIALLVFGLQPGIEFTSGSLLTVQFEQPVALNDLRSELSNLGYSSAVVQSTGSGDFQIRTGTLTDETRHSLEDGLQARFGTLTQTGFVSIEPTISRQTVRTVIIALIAAAIGILLYVTYAFRKMPKPFHYGTCGIIALLFDIILSVGLFALLAGILHWEVNLMFITGLLAVIGYSINDKIVIFDRIRENARRTSSLDFGTIVNNSLVETLTRSLITGLCTLFTIIALMLFVGSSIENFLVVLLIGIVAGTYSSILVSAPLLVVWQNNEWMRLLPWRKGKSAPG
jgi:preprotein translocase subunit SecF